MLIIPAIDVLNNKVVRLTQGDYNNVTEYEVELLEQAQIYNNHEFKWIHVIDLSGAKTGKVSLLEDLNYIKIKTRLKVQFGGGIRSTENVKALIKAGIDKIVVGSWAITNSEEFQYVVRTYGADRFIIAADVLNENVMIKGWTENSQVALNDHINYCLTVGVEHFLCTDIEKDGMMSGPNIPLYTKIIEQFPKVKLIASGGIANINDVKQLMKLNLYGTVIGKSIYEGHIDLKELSKLGK